MRFFKAISIFAILFSALFLFSDRVNAQAKSLVNSPTGYYPYTIARPQDRAWIRSLPIEQRPARPLHFYGNRVRQTYTVGPSDRSVTTSNPISPSVSTRSLSFPRFSARRR